MLNPNLSLLTNLSLLKINLSKNIQDISYISSPDMQVMTGTFLLYCKRLILSMLILCSGSTVLLSQKNLSGNINQPKTHVAILGIDRVTVDDVAGFNVSDTILLIQMQGVKTVSYTHLRAH